VKALFFFEAPPRHFEAQPHYFLMKTHNGKAQAMSQGAAEAANIFGQQVEKAIAIDAATRMLRLKLAIDSVIIRD